MSTKRNSIQGPVNGPLFKGPYSVKSHFCFTSQKVRKNVEQQNRAKIGPRFSRNARKRDQIQFVASDSEQNPKGGKIMAEIKKPPCYGTLKPKTTCIGCRFYQGCLKEHELGFQAHLDRAKEI
jgi:hypothetical protein